MPKKTESTIEKIEIKIQPTTDIPASRIHSNHVEITQSPYDFTLRFCDATPIYDMKGIEKNKGIHKIPIIAEIAIPFRLMKPLIDALQIQYDKYKEMTSESNEKKPEKK